MQVDSFDQIYQTYFDPVYRYVLSLSGSTQTAEEITQETFFKAMRSLHQFQGRSSLKSWLCAIAKNLYLSEQRKKPAASIDNALPFFDPSPGRRKCLSVRMIACVSIICSTAWRNLTGRFFPANAG